MRIRSQFIMNTIGILLGVSSLYADVAYGAGYELLEQSANGLGQAFAGTATGFGDGSEVFFNPAAMSPLPNNTASVNVHFIVPQAKFHNEGSSYIPQLGGAPLVGDGDDGGGLVTIPNGYVVWKAANDVALGLGVNTPFGLETKYDDNWVGRYHAVESSLETVNINPAISVKIDEMVSLGVGLQIVHADAKLSNAIDFGTVGISSLGLPTAAQLGLLPQQADGFVKVKGDDWGGGVGVGTLITPTKTTRVGVNWRSKIDMTLNGSADFTVPANAQVLTSTGAFTDSDAKADLVLPQTITVGVAQDLNDSWTLLADGAWTNWNDFNELRVRFDSVQPDAVQDESWENTWRASLGSRYKIDEKWLFRSGVAWDESPIPDSLHRTPRIPDNNRFWIAAGLGYNVCPSTSISVDYAHLFVADTNTTSLVNSTGSVLNGSWDLGVDIVGINLTSTF